MKIVQVGEARLGAEIAFETEASGEQHRLPFFMDREAADSLFKIEYHGATAFNGGCIG